MKTKKNLFRPLSAAPLLALVLAYSSSLYAAPFSWNGSVSGTWAPASGNWTPSPAVFDATSDLTFDTVTNGNMFLGFGRQANSLTFGPAIDSTVGVSFNGNDTTGYVLTMSPDGLVNPSINVDADAAGAITLGFVTGVGSNLGRLALAANLDVVHNGGGILNFNREISGVGFGINKSGTGTMMLNSVGTSPNTFTGDVNINAGRLIANGFVVGTDINTAANVNLGGGALEVRNISGANKDYSLVDLNVTSASTLAYQNTGATNFSLTFSGANAFDLDADLTVQNISPLTTLANPIIINRSITGLANMVVKTYNNISSASNFLLGRVALGGGNTAWAGALDIREGTAEIFGAAANMNLYTGNIILGETGNTFGAGLLLTPSANSNITFTNPITVRTGGFRTIRSSIGAFSTGGDTFYTFGGPMTLEGNLNLHVNSNAADRRVVVTGNISGAGGLQLTRGNNGFFRLSGDNKDWSGGLTIAQGTAQILGNAVNSAGTGTLTIGASADATAASLVFVPEGTGGTTVSYSNNITATPGGTRSLSGGNTNHNLTFQTGTITLDGALTVNHSFSTSDRRINLNGPISGSGALTITRSGTSTETTVRMAGTKAYLGNTTVAATASLALASDCVLTSSNVLVQATGRIGGPGTIGGNLSLADKADFYFYAVGISPASYVPMKVNGNVTMNSSFGAASIVGGSRGEVVPWGTYENGTYTLISNTASTFGNIQNFGPANAAVNISGSGKTVYFQNGGGSGSGGLQIVVATDVATPFATWSGGAAFNDDTNNDGIGNGLAFLLGADNVNVNANNLLPAPTQSGGALTLTFKMRDDRGTASLQVQHSSDLGITDFWSALETVPGITSNVGGINFTIGGTPPLLDVTATIPAAGNAVNGRLFGRVKSNP